MKRPSWLFAAALLTASTLTLSGCGSSAKTAAPAETQISATPTAQVTTTPAADASVIKIALSKDSVTQIGTKVMVKPDQPVVLQITSTVVGELHVHSSPEQHVEVPIGASEVTLTFAQPGIIDIEDHALEKLIVQLEVQ